jgi:hypothetical protein
MRRFARQLKDFWSADFHWPTYLATFLLIGVLIALNYSFGLADRTVYNKDITGIQKGLLCVGFFALPYLGALLIQVLARPKQMAGLKEPKYWLLLTVCLAFLIFAFAFPWHVQLAIDWFPHELRKWSIMVLWNLKRLVLFTLPMLMLWLLFGDRKNQFYGLFTRPKGLTPYLLLLGIMVPIVVAVSFHDSFLKAYPQYAAGNGEEALGISPWLTSLSYDLTYGLDFLSVELAYRGVLIIGLSRWLGPRALLPMMVLYCTIHFGKPLGEAVASIVAGYVLGVSAYTTRSIWGGVLLHVGSAWLMEAAAHLQKM